MSNGVVRSAIRSTQAAESLREAFSRSSGASTVVNSGDIDYYVENLKVRPSLAVDLFSGVGFALGAASRILLPLPVCHKALVHSVDEACRRSINDDLRAMSERGDSEDADPDGEVKEALKYHRDISLSSDEASEEFAESKLVNAVTAGIHSAIRITNKV